MNTETDINFDTSFETIRAANLQTLGGRVKEVKGDLLSALNLLALDLGKGNQNGEESWFKALATATANLEAVEGAGGKSNPKDALIEIVHALSGVLGAWPGLGGHNIFRRRQLKSSVRVLLKLAESSIDDDLRQSIVQLAATAHDALEG